MDFIYEKYNDTYNLSRYYDDGELLEKIQTGKGDDKIYTRFINLYPDIFFGGTIPEEIDQDTISGENDLNLANAASWTYLIDEGRNIGYNESMYEVWEMKLQDAALAFNLNSTHIKVEVFTAFGVRQAFVTNL